MSERRSRRTRGERPELVPPKSDEEPNLEDDYVDKDGNKIALGALRGRRRGRRSRSKGPRSSSTGALSKGTSSSSSPSQADRETQQDSPKVARATTAKKRGRPRGRPPNNRSRSPTPSQSSLSMFGGSASESIADEEVGDEDEDEDEDEETSSGGLESIYKSIRENKAKQEVDLPDQNIKDDRPDPGFRISHVCKDTGKVREIPPYTQPAVFIESLKKEEEEESSQTSEVTTTANISSPKDKVEGSASYSKESSNYDETTYDGYQEIFKANASSSRKEELEKMKLARMKNRSSEPPREVRKKE